MAALVVEVKEHRTRKKERMGFVKIEDLVDAIDLVLFPKTWAQYRWLLQANTVILVEGKAAVNQDRDEVKILVGVLFWLTSVELLLAGLGYLYVGYGVLVTTIDIRAHLIA